MLLSAQYVVPVTSDPIEHGAVLVREGRIEDIGPVDIMRLRYPDEENKDFGLAALLPGLIDLHGHMEDSVMRGLIHDVPYVTWLRAMKEKSARLTSDEWYASAVLGGLEALSSGITTVADITESGASLQAARLVGLRGRFYRSVSAVDKRLVNHSMKRAEKDIEKWAGEDSSGLTEIGIAAGPLFETHPAIFKRIAAYSRQNDVPVAMHLAGSQEEVNFIRRGSSVFSVHAEEPNLRGIAEIPPWLPTGVSPVRYVLNWGAFEVDNMLAIHCVHVDHDDIAKMREYDVAVATCPSYNAQLGMGVAPVNEFLRAGLRMGFGSDAPAALDSTDLFSEMRVGMLLQRAVNLGDFIDSKTLLEIGTIGAARALKMEDEVGSLECGKAADIIAVDLSGSHQTPTSDPVTAIVNSATANDVLLTMVAGEERFEKGKWHLDVDVTKNIARVIEIRGKLRG